MWRTPDVLPLDAWRTREIERRAAAGEALARVLTPAEEWFLWREAAGALTNGFELVARGPLAEGLRRASHLAHEFGISLARARGAPGTEGRLLYDAHRRVTEKASALGATTAAELAQQLPGMDGPQNLLAAGFIPEAPSLRALAESRRAHGYDLRFHTSSATGGSATRAVLAADTTEELERIADWCRARLDANSDARLLVIVPGAPEARDRLVALIRQSIDPRSAISAPIGANEATALAALEGGSPLSRAPLVAHALRSLSWLANGCDFPEFSAWLCAPYWTIPMTARARLDMLLRERAPLHILPRELLPWLSSVREPLGQSARQLATQITLALRELEGDAASPRQWSERFDKALGALQWPGERSLDSDDEQTLLRFRQLLDDFGQLAAVAGAISFDSALQWLTELAARTSFRPATGDVLVTVSSQLVDPVTRYDGIWVAGLHADQWPQPVQPDPFLPLHEQVRAGIPAASAAGRLAEAQALMNAWSASTPELVLSAPLREEDVQLAPSPLLVPHIDAASRSDDAPSLWLPVRVHRDGMTECIEDATGLQWNVAEHVPSGTRSLELQNLCPFRAYGEMRLGSVELDAPEPGVALDVRGQFLHRALEKLWKTLGGSAGLHAHADEALDALIGSCVEQAACEKFGAMPPEERPAAQRRECRRAVRLIRTLCDLERKRPPFVVQETELERVLHLAGAELRTRIDRLDALASGGLAILDYKSGRRISGDWYSERPSHPQLLAYLAAIGDQTVAMATVSVTARQIGFQGIAAEDGLLPNVRAVKAEPGEENADAWARWQREWHACIERLAADFVRGHAAVDPRPRACEYCHVVSICRISDANALAVEQNIDE